MKRFAGQLFFKDVLKIIPGLGTAASALLGYQLARMVGNDYREACRSFAASGMDTLIEELLEE